MNAYQLVVNEMNAYLSCEIDKYAIIGSVLG
jgi:hypothetical protein